MDKTNIWKQKSREKKGFFINYGLLRREKKRSENNQKQQLHQRLVNPKIDEPNLKFITQIHMNIYRFCSLSLSLLLFLSFFHSLIQRFPQKPMLFILS